MTVQDYSPGTHPPHPWQLVVDAGCNGTREKAAVAQKSGELENGADLSINLAYTGRDG